MYAMPISRGAVTAAALQRTDTAGALKATCVQSAFSKQLRLMDVRKPHAPRVLARNEQPGHDAARLDTAAALVTVVSIRSYELGCLSV